MRACSGCVSALLEWGALLGLNPGGDVLGLLGGAMVLLAAVCYAAGALLIKCVSDVPLLGSVTSSLVLGLIWLTPLVNRRGVADRGRDPR